MGDSPPVTIRFQRVAGQPGVVKFVFDEQPDLEVLVAAFTAVSELSLEEHTLHVQPPSYLLLKLNGDSTEAEAMRLVELALRDRGYMVTLFL